MTEAMDAYKITLAQLANAKRTIEALRADLTRCDEQCQLLSDHVAELQLENERLRDALTKDPT